MKLVMNKKMLTNCLQNKFITKNHFTSVYMLNNSKFMACSLLFYKFLSIKWQKNNNSSEFKRMKSPSEKCKQKQLFSIFPITKGIYKLQILSGQLWYSTSTICIAKYFFSGAKCVFLIKIKVNSWGSPKQHSV